MVSNMNDNRHPPVVPSVRSVISKAAARITDMAKVPESAPIVMRDVPVCRQIPLSLFGLAVPHLTKAPRHSLNYSHPKLTLNASHGMCT